jgi:hypothetical protein
MLRRLRQLNAFKKSRSDLVIPDATHGYYLTLHDSTPMKLGPCSWYHRSMNQLVERSSFIGLMFVIASCALVGAATPSPKPASPGVTGPSTNALALQCFHALQAGDIDRSKLTREYSDHLTEAAVATMSRYLRSYGDASSAEVLRTNVIGGQTFYLYKLFLARGDAITMLIGFNGEGKITGLTFPSMGQE